MTSTQSPTRLPAASAPLRRIGYLLELDAAQRATLEAAAGEADVVELQPDMDGPPDVEVIFGQPPPAWLMTVPHLRWVQLESAGFDAYLNVSRPGLMITNLCGLFAVPVAESVIAGLLAVYRGIDRLATLQTQSAWRKMELRPTLRGLAGASVLLAGFGTIGRAIHERLAGFGCRLTTYARTNPQADLHDEAGLDRALAEADVVIITLPATAQTRGLFSAERLSRMKRDAVLVNVGRADVIDEAALVRQLCAGALGGAVLDVTRREPLPPDDPLWATPRVILTQHTAGGNHDEQRRKLDYFLENLARFQRGQPLHGLVDLARGY